MIRAHWAMETAWRLATASTMPSEQRTPSAVLEFSTAFDAYSTWKMRPSGENVVGERSYPAPVEDMVRLSKPL